MNADNTRVLAYPCLSAFIRGHYLVSTLPVSVAQHPFPASGAEFRALHVQPFHPVAGRHHASPVGAVAQSEGVPQLVSRLLHQPLAMQIILSSPLFSVTRRVNVL